MKKIKIIVYSHKDKNGKTFYSWSPGNMGGYYDLAYMLRTKGYKEDQGYKWEYVIEDGEA